MALAAATTLFGRLQAAFDGGKVDEATTVLTELKRSLIALPSLPPMCSPSATAEQEWELARSTFEIAVLLSVQKKDSETFQRHVAQLRPFYAQPNNASKNRTTVLGLNLLFLLVENRLAEFHSELELLSDADRAVPQIAFPVHLEQSLMVGSYNNVLSAKATMPSPHYGCFMDMLLDTVREAIAECSEVAYTTLSLKAAREMMIFESEAELLAYVADNRPEWLVADGAIHFEGVKSKKVQEIPSMRLIAETLSYATEIERIV